MIKLKCKTCGIQWFSDELELCPDDESHKVTQVKTLSADDYAELWGQDLENENRHSLTDMPNEIYHILEVNIKDKKIIRRVMKSMYESGIGLG